MASKQAERESCSPGSDSQARCRPSAYWALTPGECPLPPPHDECFVCALWAFEWALCLDALACLCACLCLDALACLDAPPLLPPPLPLCLHAIRPSLRVAATGDPQRKDSLLHVDRLLELAHVVLVLHR